MPRDWKRPIVVLAFVAGLAPSAAQTAPPDLPAVELSNGEIEVVVLPSLGGRVVSLARKGGENVLDADPSHWPPPYPAPGLATDFRPWNGRIVWVGPQSAFWSQQDLRPDLRAARAPWPPDPFNETGRFEVVERTKERLRLRGDASPVTGLALEHEIAITGARTVRMSTVATNARREPVSWDLWPNTRVRPSGFPYVPVASAAAVRVEGPKAGEPDAAPYPHEVRDGWVALPPGAEPRPPQKRLWAKAFVRPAQGLIACFLPRQLLLVRAALGEVHEEQAPVELYRAAGAGSDVLELEMHGPYRTLAPGAAMSFEQTFELLDDEGAPQIERHLERLERIAR